MPRNIEIKARITSVEALAPKVGLIRLGVEPSQLIEGAYVDLLANNAGSQTVPRGSRT